MGRTRSVASYSTQLHIVRNYKYGKSHRASKSRQAFLRAQLPHMAHNTTKYGRPFSELYIGMKDADTLLGMGDDDIGRVVISVAQLHAATEYDCWMPLQRETITLEVP